MINEPIIIVLGAGASLTYGFPLGRDLISRISVSLPNWRGASPPFGDVLADMGFEQTALAEFCDALVKAQAPSIDHWLARQSPEFQAIGKHAIAGVLLQCEKPRAVFEDEEYMRDRNGPSWYRYLWHQIIDDSDLTLTGLLNDFPVTFITFNYDRSLEHFLFNAIKHYFASPASCDDDILQMLRDKIYHVHGSLGAYQLDSTGDGRPYDPGSSMLLSDAISRAVKSLRIVHEVKHFLSDDATVGGKAMVRFWRDAANTSTKKIIFLGFGYFEANLRKLFEGCRDPNIGEHFRDVSIWCSNCQIKRRSRCEDIRRQIGELTGSNDIWIDPRIWNFGTYEFLSETDALA